MAFRRGEARLETPQGVYTIKPGRLACLPAGSSWRLATAHGFQCIGITVRQPADGYHFGAACGVLATPAIQHLLAVVEQELSGAHLRTSGLLTHLALALVELVQRQAAAELAAPAAHAKDYWANRVQAILEANLDSSLTLEAQLAELDLSPRQLRRHFHAMTGMGPKAWQSRRRLEQACRLLRETETSLTELALALGYASLQHFSDCFSHALGCSPTAYRRAATSPRESP
jgi:AraC-like DNA-binding protein